MLSKHCLCSIATNSRVQSSISKLVHFHWLTLYFVLQVVYALLMPASAPLGEDASDFQYNFLKSGGLPLVLSMLTRNNFLPNADMETRRGAYLNALKIAKLLLTAIGYGHVRAVAEACQPVVEGTSTISPVI